MQLHMRGISSGIVASQRTTRISPNVHNGAKHRQRRVLRPTRASGAGNDSMSDQSAELSPIQTMAIQSMEPEAPQNMEMEQEVFMTESGVVEPVNEEEAGGPGMLS